MIGGHVGKRRQRAFVDDPLLADLAPARHDGRVIRVGGIAMHQVARAVFVDPVLRIVEPIRIRHRVEVIEVAEKFIEAVHGRQIFVEVAEMVLAELPGSVAERFEHGGERHRLLREADVRTGLTDCRETGAHRKFAGDEIGAAGGAACFGVVVGKPHAFGRKSVEIGRLPRHDTAMIGADVEPADIVAHDDEDVRRPARCRRLLRLRLADARGRAECRRGGECGGSKQYVTTIESVVV